MYCLYIYIVYCVTSSCTTLTVECGVCGDQASIAPPGSNCVGISVTHRPHHHRAALGLTLGRNQAQTFREVFRRHLDICCVHVSI